MIINTLIALVYFGLSVANDDLNVQWHIARRKVQPVRGGLISLAMGVIAWIPYLLFVTTNNWQIIVADLAGNYVGSHFGILRHGEKEDESDETENSDRTDGEGPVG
jgi:uncharacterized membrane protein